MTTGTAGPAPQTALCPGCGIEKKVNVDGTVRKHGRPVPCAGSGTPVGTARIPRRVKGFYRDPVTEDRLRSVTTILGQGAPKQSLIHWAAALVAETAMEHLPTLVRASLTPQGRREVTEWLKEAPNRRKEERGGIGSAVHELIEAHILGQPIPDELASNPEFAPYVQHFRRFVADWQVTFTASEMVVANYEAGYAGTLDYTLTSPLLTHVLNAPSHIEFMGDTKTGGELDARTYDGGIKGVYPEAGLQMAAYRRAPYGWLRDGTRVARPLAHDVGVVLHLRPEGYRLYPVRCGDTEYEVFTHVQRVAEFLTGTARSVVGAAVSPPTPPNPAPHSSPWHAGRAPTPTAREVA